VQAVAGLVDSPFDAELVAGLSAVTLAAMMAGTGTGDGGEAPAATAGTWVLHTDSKTLARAVRTGVQGDLADRASPSRLALWRLLDTHTRALATRGRPVDVVWIPGHPERRDSDRTRWSQRDVGIWAADEVAKDGCDGAVVLEGLLADGSAAAAVDGAPRRGLAKPKRDGGGGGKQQKQPKSGAGEGGDGAGGAAAAIAREPKKKVTAAVAALREEQAEAGAASEGGHEATEAGEAATAAPTPEADGTAEGTADADEAAADDAVPAASRTVTVPVVTITGADLVRLSHAVALRRT
jgi:hypothetical protein